MRLLIVAPYFPPKNSPGATRIVKVSTELVELGVDVTVMTTDDARQLHDDVAVPREINVQRVRSPDPSALRIWLEQQRVNRIAGLWDIPDRGVRWNSVAREICVQAHARHPFDAIWTSSNPVSASIVGAELSRELSLPLVAEFRDPWTQNPFRTWNSRLHFEQERRQHRRVATAASSVVMNTNVARRQLLDEFRLPADKIRVITNGFDPTEYPSGAAVDETDTQAHLLFAHVGNLYSLAPPANRNWKGRMVDALNDVGTYRRAPFDPLCRSPFFLFEAMELLKQRRPRLPEQMSFHQVGSVGASPADYRQLVERFGLDGMCSQTERVTRAEALQHERLADVLVLAQLKPGDGSACPAVAAKTYGALASQKPILGLVPHGDMRELLEGSGRAAIADPDDPAEIAAAIDAILSRSLAPAAGSDDFDLGPYEWSAIARQVFETISDAIERHDGLGHRRA